MIPDLPAKDNSVEVEDDVEAGAQSEPQANDSADAETSPMTDTQGFEKPMTWGSIDT
jgi:hypothetical protein